MSVVIEQLDDVEIAKIVTRGLRALNARHEDFGDSLSEDIGAACDTWDNVWARLCECDCNGGAIWPMASDSDAGWPYVERCDDCQRFRDDIDAAHFVAERENGIVIWHALYDQPGRWQPAVHAARMREPGFWGP
jgi:hypothetical protein